MARKPKELPPALFADALPRADHRSAHRAA
jgi:hypothetical protein